MMVDTKQAADTSYGAYGKYEGYTEYEDYPGSVEEEAEKMQHGKFLAYPDP